MTSRRSGRGRRGFTLMELLTVIAIIGVLSALAGSAFVGISKVSKVNGGASALARVLATTRMRAITERCPYFVQINGPKFTPSAPPAGMFAAPGRALVYRKGNCDSTVAWYEPGASLAARDKLVDQVWLSEFSTIYKTTPAGVVTGDQLDTGSLTVHFNVLGQRSVAADNDADGTSTDSAIGATDLTVEVVATPGGASDPRRQVLIPQAGSARAP